MASLANGLDLMGSIVSDKDVGVCGLDDDVALVICNVVFPGLKEVA